MTDDRIGAAATRQKLAQVAGRPRRPDEGNCFGVAVTDPEESLFAMKIYEIAIAPRDEIPVNAEAVDDIGEMKQNKTTKKMRHRILK